MGNDRAAALQEELHQFVSQIRHRLSGLAASLSDLQESSRVSTGASTSAEKERWVPVAMEDQLNNHIVKAPDTDAQPTRPVIPRERAVESSTGDLIQLEQAVANNSLDATDRLAAIKHRLAQQIENT